MLSVQNTINSYITKALSGVPQVVPRGSYSWGSTLSYSSPSMSLKCDPKWDNFRYTGTGFALSFTDLKDADIASLKLIGGGIEFIATESSSRVELSSMRLQGANTGYLWSAPNGEDISCWTLTAVEAFMCGTGFKVVGSNALDFHLVNCRATECTVGLDLVEGGAGSVLDHFGGSKCQTLVRIGGGYECDIRYLTSELCGTVLQIGTPEDAGQNMDHTISFGNNRDCQLLADIYGAGEKTLVFSKPEPQVVRFTNKSDRVAKLNIVGNPNLTVHAVGKVEVSGAVTIQK